MRLRLTALMVVIAALVVVSPAQAHLVTKPKADTLKARAVSQKENLAHARYVCKRGDREHKAWSCRAVEWLKHELAETQKVLNPPRPKGTQPFALPACTNELLNLEGGWNPTVYNHAGSGAYGGPQALPGHKMASAGPDWRTNIWTQIKWMIGYANGRYGGMCNALAFRRAYGYY